ncbi:GyrI-like domain-containing protein [Bacteroides sp.]|uniref:AraC family transcriptional regulator n=1 Tax=Bacteroides sp. TaxID=29523 RepID=UPI00261EFE7C|nr:AraC family transcriptional regulator [Bacteroides sp.]MDD3039257.1 AraC family transcriptional regulator [Bacteroides sp.]
MRNSTENIYHQKVNQVIDYISANLHLPLQLDVIADKINVSQRQLLRIMRSALNESLYAYVARQRIERAVLCMQTEDISLTKLAEMVGYDNPQSLSKAFKKQFGISPKAYRDELQSRLEGYVQSSGNRSRLQSEICYFEGLELVYIRIFGKYGEAEPYETAWNKLMRFLKDNHALTPETRFIGLSFDDPNVTNHRQCRFYACASVQKKIIPTGEFGTIQLKQGKYAVYTLMGSCSGLQELYNNISVNFEYTTRHGMAFEEYINYSKENSEKDMTKIYIPIK